MLVESTLSEKYTEFIKNQVSIKTIDCFVARELEVESWCETIPGNSIGFTVLLLPLLLRRLNFIVLFLLLPNKKHEQGLGERIVMLRSLYFWSVVGLHASFFHKMKVIVFVRWPFHPAPSVSRTLSSLCTSEGSMAFLVFYYSFSTLMSTNSMLCWVNEMFTHKGSYVEDLLAKWWYFVEVIRSWITDLTSGLIHDCFNNLMALLICGQKQEVKPR